MLCVSAWLCACVCLCWDGDAYAWEYISGCVYVYRDWYTQQMAELEEDEEAMEAQEMFEHKYNFRFEEPDKDFVSWQQRKSFGEGGESEIVLPRDTMFSYMLHFKLWLRKLRKPPQKNTTRQAWIKTHKKREASGNKRRLLGPLIWRREWAQHGVQSGRQHRTECVWEMLLRLFLPPGAQRHKSVQGQFVNGMIICAE